MKKFCSALLLILLFSTAAAASFSAMTEFKAIIVEYEEGQKTENPVWITKDKSRREFDEGREIIVTRNDLKVTWFIYPQIRCYVEIPALGTFANFNMPDEKADTGDLKREFLNYEERDGFKMKKYLVTVKYSGFNSEDKYYEWTRNDFPVPVRTESVAGNSWTEYKKISRGPIDYKLFDTPRGYKKVSEEDAERLLNEYRAKHPIKAKKAKKQKRQKNEMPVTTEEPVE